MPVPFQRTRKTMTLPLFVPSSRLVWLMVFFVVMSSFAIMADGSAFHLFHPIVHCEPMMSSSSVSPTSSPSQARRTEEIGCVLSLSRNPSLPSDVLHNLTLQSVFPPDRAASSSFSSDFLHLDGACFSTIVQYRAGDALRSSQSIHSVADQVLEDHHVTTVEDDGDDDDSGRVSTVKTATKERTLKRPLRHGHEKLRDLVHQKLQAPQRRALSRGGGGDERADMTSEEDSSESSSSSLLLESQQQLGTFTEMVALNAEKLCVLRPTSPTTTADDCASHSLNNLAGSTTDRAPHRDTSTDVTLRSTNGALPIAMPKGVGGDLAVPVYLATNNWKYCTHVAQGLYFNASTARRSSSAGIDKEEIEFYRERKCIVAEFLHEICMVVDAATGVLTSGCGRDGAIYRYTTLQRHVLLSQHQGSRPQHRHPHKSASDLIPLSVTVCTSATEDEHRRLVQRAVYQRATPEARAALRRARDRLVSGAEYIYDDDADDDSVGNGLMSHWAFAALGPTFVLIVVMMAGGGVAYLLVSK